MIFDGNFQVQAPLGGGGAYIRRGDITESFLRYEFGAGGGGFYLEGLIQGGVCFRNFTVPVNTMRKSHNHILSRHW